MPEGICSSRASPKTWSFTYVFILDQIPHIIPCLIPPQIPKRNRLLVINVPRPLRASMMHNPAFRVLVFFFLDTYTSRDLLARHERLSHNLDASPASNQTHTTCLLYTSDAADDSLRVDFSGRRILKNKIFFFFFLFFFFFFFFFYFFFFFSSRRRHTRFLPVSWARRCV